MARMNSRGHAPPASSSAALSPYALDADAAYLALQTRDARFDGQFFVGVTSTGVYCRPICRVRLPRRANCRFFNRAAQAEAAGFRPCLKCRPEIAPGQALPWTVMDASDTLAQQTARWLDAHAHDASPDAGSSLLVRAAGAMGITERHLRRIFSAALGVTPQQYLQTRRLLLAKQLLTDTALPVSQVALASGYGSLRSFNTAFAAHYRLSPSQLRRAHDGKPRAAQAPGVLALKLATRTPFDAASLLAFIAQRAIPGIEQVDGLIVRRTLRAGVLGPQPTWIEAELPPTAAHYPDDAPRPLEVLLRVPADMAPNVGRAVRLARRWLDLDADSARIDTHLQGLPGPPGMRLPGAPDAFELAVRAVLGQQVSVAAARTLASRLVQRLGPPVHTPWLALTHSCPAPESLLAAGEAGLTGWGLMPARARTLLALAQAWPGLEASLQADDIPACLTALTSIPGIGPWTAHYIAMRALGWPDAFPPGDVGLLRALHIEGRGAAAQARMEQAAAAWQPWRAYAVMRLWHGDAADLAPTAGAAAHR